MTTIPKRFPPGTPLHDRLLGRSLINPETGCWEWQGTKNGKGYGLIQVSGSAKIVHRVSYGLIKGPIPNGLHLDHLCRVRHCINPAHLEPVTNQENLSRSPITVSSRRAAQTHCVNGHEFTPENTYLRPYKDHTNRVCRACVSNRKCAAKEAAA